jgi:translation elongation factor EF-Tu-like GTPase
LEHKRILIARRRHQSRSKGEKSCRPLSSFPRLYPRRRFTPSQAGFRPQVDVRGTHTSCIVESLSGDELLSPCREHRVSLKLMFPDQHPSAFEVGDSVRLYEGSNLIATGKIIEL